MKLNYDFYAIVDDEDAIVSVMHPKYGEMKAVFADKKLAVATI